MPHGRSSSSSGLTDSPGRTRFAIVPMPTQTRNPSPPITSGEKRSSMIASCRAGDAENEHADRRDQGIPNRVFHEFRPCRRPRPCRKTRGDRQNRGRGRMKQPPRGGNGLDFPGSHFRFMGLPRFACRPGDGRGHAAQPRLHRSERLQRFPHAVVVGVAAAKTSLASGGRDPTPGVFVFQVVLHLVLQFLVRSKKLRLASLVEEGGVFFRPLGQQECAAGGNLERPCSRCFRNPAGEQAQRDLAGADRTRVILAPDPRSANDLPQPGARSLRRRPAPRRRASPELRPC